MPDRTYPKSLTHPTLPPMIARSPVQEQELVARGYAPVVIPTFSEYPIALTHPDHVPAKQTSPARYDTPDGTPTRGGGQMMAAARLHSFVAAVHSPERFPAVIAKDAEEERKYAAQGYVRSGAHDSAAFSKAVAANVHPQAEVCPFLEHPKWLTSPDGEAVLAKTAEDEAAYRKLWRKRA